MESFIPSFSPEAALPPSGHHKTIFGFPIINPVELRILHSREYAAWRFYYRGTCDGLFRGNMKVSVLIYDSIEHFRTSMTRAVALQQANNAEELIACPQFVALDRSGGIVVGYKRFESEPSYQKETEAFDDLKMKLESQGWETPGYFGPVSKSQFNWVEVDGKVNFVCVDLSCLEASNPSIMEEESSDGSDSMEAADPLEHFPESPKACSANENMDGNQTQLPTAST